MVRFAVTHPTAGLPGCCRSSHWCAPQLCCLPVRSPACHRPGYWRGGARWSSTSETGSSEIWCCDWPGPAAAGSWWHWKRPGRCGSPRRRRTSSAIWRDRRTMTKKENGILSIAEIKVKYFECFRSSTSCNHVFIHRDFCHFESSVWMSNLWRSWRTLRAQRLTLLVHIRDKSLCRPHPAFETKAEK